jgi:hypothetical protein
VGGAGHFNLTSRTRKLVTQLTSPWYALLCIDHVSQFHHFSVISIFFLHSKTVFLKFYLNCSSLYDTIYSRGCLNSANNYMHACFTLKFGSVWLPTNLILCLLPVTDYQTLFTAWMWIVLQLLRSPCHIDLSLRVDKFVRPPVTRRSEAWLFIDAVSQVSIQVWMLRHPWFNQQYMW